MAPESPSCVDLQTHDMATSSSHVRCPGSCHVLSLNQRSEGARGWDGGGQRGIATRMFEAFKGR